MKKIISIFLLVCIIVTTSVSASVVVSDKLVVDKASLLSQSEFSKLTNKVDKIKTDYDFNIIILTVNSIEGYNRESYCSAYFEKNGYKNDLMLLISIDDREFNIKAGGTSQRIFDDYYLDVINDQIVPYLSDGKYNSAFNKFVDLAEKNLKLNAQNKPVISANNEYKEITSMELWVSIGIAILAAFIIVFAFKAKMNNAVKQSMANSYVENDSFVLNQSRDSYLYSTVTKTKIPKSNGGSSGGSRSSSSGNSGGHF